MQGKDDKTQTVSLRGGRRDSESAKVAKRDFGMVSPFSPENQVTLSNIGILFKETLEPIIIG